MSLEYYLLCREKYSFILKYLEGINELLNDVINITDNENMVDKKIVNFFIVESNDNSLHKIKENIIKLKHMCDNKIAGLCIHDFECDMIDITPDRSENIEYCKICGFTK